MCELFKEEVPD